MRQSSTPQGFRLDGGDRKALRQAVNRVARKGYRVEFHDSTTIDADLRAGLERLIGVSPHGDAEHGFSTNLGRLFDPTGTGLLIVVQLGPEDRPGAF